MITVFSLTLPEHLTRQPDVNALESWMCQTLPQCKQLVRWAIIQADAHDTDWLVEGAYLKAD